MEVWIDPKTNRIKAIYTPGKYVGVVWQNRGYVAYYSIESWMLPYEPPTPDSLEPTTLVGEDGKEYIIGINGIVKEKPVTISI